MLIGREHERAHIACLLAAASQGHGEALLIVGEAGIGKTALMRWAMETAGDLRVLQARGVESESELAYAGLSALLRPVVALVESLPERQRDALSAALLLESGEVVGVDRYSVYAATLELLAAAAESAPVLVAVDDLHWVDNASREALLFSARRLGAERITMMLSTRTDEASGLQVDDLPALYLSGLPENEAVELATASGAIVPGVARVLTRATGGNPLALEELPALLTPAQRRGFDPLPDPVPAGARVTAAFRSRLRNLNRGVQQALLVAAATDSGDLHEVRSALTTLGLSPDKLEVAEAAGLIHLHPPELVFRHPLVRSTVYQEASDAERREAHRALAITLDETDAARRAWHLAAAAVAPDEQVALRLEETAHQSQVRGAPLAAASALETAARLSPRRADRARRLVAAARHAYLGGSPQHAASLLDGAAELATEERVRIDVEHARLVVSLFEPSGIESARERLLGLAGQIEARDPAAAVLMYAHVAFTYAAGAQPRALIELTDRAILTSRRAGRQSEALMLVMRALGLVLAGASDNAYATLTRAEPQLAGLAPEQVMYLAAFPGVVRTYTGRYDEARSELLRYIESARRMASLPALPTALGLLATVEFRRGDWLAASAAASEAVRLAEEVGQHTAGSAACTILACVEAGQGHDSRCRRHVEEVFDIAALGERDSLLCLGGAALGLLELGSGHYQAAIDALARVDALECENGIGIEASQSLPLLIEAYTRAGRRRDAGRHLAELERRATRSPTPWALAVTARCRGILAAERGFDQHFRKALSAHEGLPAAFERARTRAWYGERLRRTGRHLDARAQLARAVATFEALGAAPWAARARAELELSGVTSAVGGSPLATLTPQELQVALKVSEGASNREAACALFVTVKTIEAHLRSVYRKLEIRSRSELTRLMVLHQHALQRGAAGQPYEQPPADETLGFSSMR